MRIAIQTEEMRFYFKLLKLFEKSRFPIKSKFYLPTQSIDSSSFDLVIRTPNPSSADILRKSESNILHLSYNELTPYTVSQLLGLVLRKYEPKFQEVIIGVDPGEHVGVAAICDGMFLAANTVNLEELNATINNYLATFPGERVVIRVGNLPMSISKTIFNHLHKVYGNWKSLSFEIVEESFTNLPKGAQRTELPRDAAAAVAIAHRPGRKTDHQLRNEIPSGRIRQIQKWSREKSGNQITLDKELARLVALGQLTLDSAIDLKRTRMGGQDK
ncbi:MAG: hypothetical protein ACFFFG_18445 [Candidatus Thorarchaeota archaeon]